MTIPLAIYNTMSGQRERTLLRYNTNISSVAFSPSGKQLASVDNGEIKLWNVESGKLEHVHEEPTHWVTHVVYAPDGKHLVTGGSVVKRALLMPIKLRSHESWRTLGASEVHMWDLEIGELTWTRRLPSERIRSGRGIAVSPDGRWLAGAIYVPGGPQHGYEIPLWDLTKRAHATTIPMQEDGDTTAHSVCFSPDSSTLAFVASGVRGGKWQSWLKLWTCARRS